MKSNKQTKKIANRCKNENRPSSCNTVTCSYAHVFAAALAARQLRAAARTEGSGGVLRDALTPDLHPVALCCCGWHKRRTQWDLIGCDWPCSASLKQSEGLIFVTREKQEMQRVDGGMISWVENWEHHKGSYNLCWHICSRSYYFPVSERVLNFSFSLLVFLSPSIHPVYV